jgi:hypothetical protein
MDVKNVAVLEVAAWYRLKHGRCSLFNCGSSVGYGGISLQALTARSRSLYSFHVPQHVPQVFGGLPGERNPTG